MIWQSVARSGLVVVVVFASTVRAWSQSLPEAPDSTVEYTITLDQPQTQMAGISILIEDIGPEPLEFMLPVWRPGRYVVLNQANAVRDVYAVADDGRALAVEKTDKATWRVDPAGARAVRLGYRVYANSLADRTRHVDDTHAFLSGAAVLMYTPTRRSSPCTVRVVKPDPWRIACGLNRDPRDPNTLVAANYDVLVDSPLEIGLHEVIAFEAAGKPHEVVIWGWADYEADKLVADLTKIIEEATGIFESAPYERYVFILHVGAGASGGTEHLNSTVMQISRAALQEPTAYRRMLGLAAHEFFHTWNVKAFRPRGLNPYDYQRENYTRLLWVVEGTTSYYDDLLLARTGQVKATRYLETLSTAIDGMRRKPADTVQSLEQASFDAWIQFASHSADDVNAKVDFYGKGALVSLLIDLEMRRRSGDRANLDQVMRALYERFPLNCPGYVEDDLLSIIEELSGNDFDDLFENHIRAAQPIDYTAAFAHVGLELHFEATKRDDADKSAEEEAEQSAATLQGEDGSEGADKTPPIKANLGVNLSDSSGTTVVTSVSPTVLHTELESRLVTKSLPWTAADSLHPRWNRDSAR